MSQFGSALHLACAGLLRYGDVVKRIVVILSLLSFCAAAQARVAHACFETQRGAPVSVSAATAEKAGAESQDEHTDSSGTAAHHCDICVHISSVSVARLAVVTDPWLSRLPEPLALPPSVIADPVPDRLYKPPR